MKSTHDESLFLDRDGSPRACQIAVKNVWAQGSKRMGFMRMSKCVGLLCLALCVNASACQYIFQTTLLFAENSARLNRDNVVKLKQWIDQSIALYPKFESALVESGAWVGSSTEKDAANLAKRRAQNTAQAMRVLLPDDLPIRTVSQIYRQKIEHGSRNDFAAVQIYPDQSAAPALGCSPASSRIPTSRKNDARLENEQMGLEPSADNAASVVHHGQRNAEMARVEASGSETPSFS